MNDDTRSVSVLIWAADLGDRLPEIVTALDDQTLPYNRYQTIFVDPGSADGTSKRLRELEQRRPNVLVLTGADQTGPDQTWRSAVEAASGDFVLCLGPADLLFPDGLEALLATAAAGHDLVLAGGGDDGPAGFLPESLTPGKSLDPSAPMSGIGVLAPFALVRRDALLTSLPDSGPGLPLRQTRVRLLRSVGSVGTCAMPVGVGSGPRDKESAQEIWADAAAAAELLDDRDVAAWFVAAHASAIIGRTAGAGSAHEVDDQIVDLVQRHWKDRDSNVLPFAQRQVVQALVERDLTTATAAALAVSRLDLAATSTSAEWSSGVLNLLVNGTIAAGPGVGDAVPDGCRIQLSARNVANALQYDLPAESTLDQSSGTVRFIAQTTVDIARAAHGSPLTPGVWEIVVRLAGVGAARPVSSSVPFCAVPGAIVDGTPVGVFAADGGLRLDVGARRHGFLGAPYEPAQATIAQTAEGALLTLAATELAVRGDATIPSALFLGNFRLPAVLRASEGSARLECYVSGLAGVSKLGAKIGDAVREPLGLQLRIGAVGDMAVEAITPTTGANQPTGANKASAAKKASGTKKPSAAKKASGTKKPSAAKKASGTKKPSGAKKAAGGAKRTRASKRSGRVLNRLPEPLRPLARQLARSPLVQQAYRRVVRRG